MLTVRELMPEVRSVVSSKSLPTYGTGLRLLETSLGDVPLSEVRAVDLRRLRDDVQRRAGQQRVDSARSRGRPLRAYDPDAHGQGAAENFVRAARFFFAYAVDAGHLAASPAEALTAPPRAAAPERPLTEDELAQIWRVVTTTGNDIELDRRILAFLRHTAARREGCLNLCLDHLDHRRRSVLLTEKNGRTRELPLQARILSDLETFARSRGASGAGDAVFRYGSGRPLTRRRFNSIFDRVDRHLGWTEPLDVAAHWIRHTTLSDIAAVAGVRVAAAYAGHADSSLGVIGRYTKVSWEDLCDAYEAAFGARDDG